MADVTTKNYVARIADLLPSQENPRTIDRKEYEALKKSLIEFPEMKQLREIIVDEEHKILAGHQRVLALQELGYADVYVRQVFGLTAKQKREFMIKDNVSAGKWDSDIIRSQWDLSEIENFGLPSLNIPSVDIDDHGESSKKKPFEVTCPECGFYFDATNSEY